MNTDERIAKVRELTPFDFMNGANYVLVQQLCDELEKAQTEIQDMKEANEVRQIIATAANKVLCKYEEVEERVKAKRKYWSSMKSDATWFTTDLTVALDGCLAPLDKTDEKGYWWCPVHGKVTREHNCEGYYHDVPVNEFGVTEPCWEELEHRTDEKGGTRPPDEHHELQDFADKRTAPGEQKAEKVYIDDLLSLPPDEQKDELRCIDCGEKARAVNTRNGFCYVCEHNNHTTTAFYPTKASAKAAYRKLIDDRAIADRARAEDRRLNEDCTDYLTGWLDCASRIVYGSEGS